MTDCVEILLFEPKGRRALYIGGPTFQCCFGCMVDVRCGTCGSMTPFVRPLDDIVYKRVRCAGCDMPFLVYDGLHARPLF